jgi:hypothetical protein
MLADLERDLVDNPIPPPAWLRHGAPVGSLIYVDGQARPVEGHMYGEADYLIVTPEGDVPYLQATNESGVPLFEPRTFEKPQVEARLSRAPAAPAKSGLSVEDLRAGLEQEFGRAAAARLIDQDIVRLVSRVEDLPERLRALARENRAQGLYDPSPEVSPPEVSKGVTSGGDITYLIGEHLTDGNVRGVALHEIGVHFNLERILGAEKYREVLAQLRSLEKWGNRAVRGARKRAQEAGNEAWEDEETLAYLVEDPANHDLSLVRRILAAVRAFLFKLGLVKHLTTDDLVAIVRASARAAVRREAGPVVSPPEVAKGVSKGARAALSKGQGRLRKGDTVIVSTASTAGLGKAAGKTGTITGTFGDDITVRLEGLPGKFILPPSELTRVEAAPPFKQISPDENKRRVDAYLAEHPALDARPAEDGETFRRVVWSPVGDGTLETNPLDLLSLPKGENVSGLHVTTEPEHWAKLLQEDYERNGRFRIIEIAAMPGDVVVDDPQQAMPSEMFGRTLDSHLLITGRERLKRGRDKVYLSRAPSATTGAAPSALDSARAKIGHHQKTLADQVRDLQAGGWAGVKERLAVLSEELKQGAVDRYYGIDRAERLVKGAVPHSQSGYIAARLATGLASVMRAVLLHGAPVWKDGILAKQPGSQGLLKALEPVKGELDDFLHWMIGERAARLKGEGRERLFSGDEIRALQALAQGREERFKKARGDYTAIKTAILDVAQEAGLVDPETRPLWDRHDYLPFYRLLEDSQDTHGNKTGGNKTGGPRHKAELSGQSSGIRRLKGGKENVGEPLENIILNFSHLLDASLKNMALKRTLDNVGGVLTEKVPMTERFKPALIPGKEAAKVVADEYGALLESVGVDPEPARLREPPGSLQGAEPATALGQRHRAGDGRGQARIPPGARSAPAALPHGAERDPARWGGQAPALLPSACSPLR